MSKKLKIILICLGGVILIFAALVTYGYLTVYRPVMKDAELRLEQGAIKRNVASESPVYFDDGKSLIGVFFEKTHLRYIAYEDIPKVFVKAIIASEDKNFFDHRGFDILATLRAFWANIKAGKVVQGGSSITQQTAKSIFKRERRSYQAKLKELLQAILLEKRFSKEKILEIYINQFFVTGYGKGLRIAAQYFFDKKAEDLDLVEAAFIAGSLKAPNRYNPFIKKTDKEKALARQMAMSRKNYVLDNMLKTRAITREQFLSARKREIPFKEGQVTFRLNVILDYVREQLQSDYFKAVLQEQGVDNFATSGISIFTSVNKPMQESALRSIRTHVPVMDTKITGYEIKNIIKLPEEELDVLPDRPTNSLPFVATITSIKIQGEKSELGVSWKTGNGVINYEGFRPIADAWWKFKRGPWATFDKTHVSRFLKIFRVGAQIPVQAVPSDDPEGKQVLRLSRFPEMNGGLVVLQSGMIKAMVGGFYNRYYNRAADAKRQLGSIFKPIVYAAALQLKWNTLDSLPNLRNLYRFEDTIYLPQPDHEPKSDKVSIAWAGAMSENLATVWLLYHLTDRLNLSEFRKVTHLLGIGRKPEESYLSYKERIRDRYGVNVNKDALMEAAFEDAKKQIESDIIFGGYEEVWKNLNRLRFQIDKERLIECEELDLKKAKDRQLLQDAMKLSFNRIRDLHTAMKIQIQKIQTLVDQYRSNKNQETRQSLSRALANFFVAADGRIIYSDDSGSSAGGASLTPEELLAGGHLLGGGEVWIDGLIPAGILDLLLDSMREGTEKLLANKRYDLDTLHKVRDFRTLTNLLYVVRLAKKLGISTELNPVLSFPLGPYSVSIIEAALAYETILTGRIHTLPEKARPEMVPIITKILDREGNLIWEHQPKWTPVLSPRVSRLTGEILRKVMLVGTGKKARNAVKLFDISIPSFGKTGTANRFTNSSFVGMIPGPNRETGQLDVNRGYVIAAYVGYDDNRPMKHKRVEIYGASGALPLWIDTAQAIVNTDGYRQGIEPADIAFEPLTIKLPRQGKGFVKVPVSPVTGLPDSGEASRRWPRVLAEGENPSGMIGLSRRFDPLEGEKK